MVKYVLRNTAHIVGSITYSKVIHFKIMVRLHIPLGLLHLYYRKCSLKHHPRDKEEQNDGHQTLIVT